MEDDPVEIPIGDVFDLHTIAPRDAKAAVEAYLEEAYRRGFRALRIVHGRGIGVQREMVRTVLGRTPYVVSFQDAPAEAGGWGATIVTLGEEIAVAKTQQMSEELAGLMRQYDAALEQVENLVTPLTRDQFNWRDEPGHWSVGQCIEHLTVTCEVYIVKVREAIDEGKRLGYTGVGPFRYGWLESYFLRVTEPPPRFRVKAPKVFRPAGKESPALDPKEVLRAYRDINRRLRGLLEEANGLDLRRIKTASPATSLMKFSLGIILATIPAHDRRHLWQARQMIARPGFPKS